ncbi:hypothetical protein GCM10009747_13100 [Agromyces humatus]|uniref:Uncharacterized protein n=1 Tax=Agromyces humatus TaxID=279573 RepID=A0ABP4WJS7_9MICO
MSDAYFERLDERRFRPTAHGRGMGPDRAALQPGRATAWVSTEADLVVGEVASPLASFIALIADRPYSRPLRHLPKARVRVPSEASDRGPDEPFHVLAGIRPLGWLRCVPTTPFSQFE